MKPRRLLRPSATACLPGAGKSTLAQLLHDELRRSGWPVEILDGDEVRQRLSKGLGFTRDDRDENVRHIAYVARLLCRVGGVAIVAAVLPYEAARKEARREIGNFVEVFVHCPLEICMRRDPKGLYAKARRGEAQHVSGLSDPYEAPTNPDVIVDTGQESPRESLENILSRLIAMGYIRTAR